MVRGDSASVAPYLRLRLVVCSDENVRTEKQTAHLDVNYGVKRKKKPSILHGSIISSSERTGGHDAGNVVT